MTHAICDMLAFIKRYEPVLLVAMYAYTVIEVPLPSPLLQGCKMAAGVQSKSLEQEQLPVDLQLPREF